MTLSKGTLRDLRLAKRAIKTAQKHVADARMGVSSVPADVRLQQAQQWLSWALVEVLAAPVKANTLAAVMRRNKSKPSQRKVA